MKKTVFLLFGSMLMFAIAFFIEIPKTAAQPKTITVPGAIIFSLPPGCDCTIPASTCYCKVTVPT